MNTPAAPALPWLGNIVRLLPIRSQFVLSGDIRDHFLMPSEHGPVLVPLLRALWETLRPLGFRVLVVWDPVDGVRAYPATEEARELAAELLDVQKSAAPMGLEALAALAGKVTRLRAARVALVIDFASRITRSTSAPDAGEHRLFVACEKLALEATPISAVSIASTASTTGKAGTAEPAAAGTPASDAKTSAMPAVPTVAAPAPAWQRLLFNPIVWVTHREQDLPSWFALDSERIEPVVIPRPDLEARAHAALSLGPLFHDFDASSIGDRTQYAKVFADATDGFSLVGLADVAQLAAAQRLPIGRVDDAVRCYKVGAVDNPWKKDYLRAQIAGASELIERRVKGQRQAVVKAIDILTRSVMGLTGAQSRTGSNRPRGVLFFAGPTGVGKTELAKSLTELIFGDERAYIRFDMSEFAAEHSSARLLGAPPGYVGYDAGGELTNAVRARPFSVVLFDEIEKAHPRILDKFLQILEDGRLTDGRGQTAYFSEAVIVFTSNLGIVVEDEHGRRTQSVTPGQPYAEVESRVRLAIAEHFKFRLQRPEILNRIGDNIVVFDFIAPPVADRIFDGMLANVLAKVRDEHGIELSLAPTVREQLRGICTHDLAHGGRGIGNQLESVFINPLARALFGAATRPRMTIVGLEQDNRIWSLDVRGLESSVADAFMAAERGQPQPV